MTKAGTEYVHNHVFDSYDLRVRKIMDAIDAGAEIDLDHWTQWRGKKRLI